MVKIVTLATQAPTMDNTEYIRRYSDNHYLEQLTTQQNVTTNRKSKLEEDTDDK